MKRRTVREFIALFEKCVGHTIIYCPHIAEPFREGELIRVNYETDVGLKLFFKGNPFPSTCWSDQVKGCATCNPKTARNNKDYNLQCMGRMSTEIKEQL